MRKYRVTGFFNRGPNKGKEFDTCLVADDHEDLLALFELQYSLAELVMVDGKRFIGVCVETDLVILEGMEFELKNGELCLK